MNDRNLFKKLLYSLATLLVFLLIFAETVPNLSLLPVTGESETVMETDTGISPLSDGEDDNKNNKKD
ncbi:MAG: hypothetical protein HFI38_03675 [Lachnospiraceae bacterium]|jgi:hypothetical protein|nr:hypothetical protein [Lachnospiraceae bacterium]